MIPCIYCSAETGHRDMKGRARCVSCTASKCGWHGRCVCTKPTPELVRAAIEALFDEAGVVLADAPDFVVEIKI